MNADIAVLRAQSKLQENAARVCEDLALRMEATILLCIIKA